MNTRNLYALLFVCLGLAAFDAHSEGLKPITFGVHLHSHHLPDRDWHNNQNRGFYIRGESYQLGAYNNTLGRDTIYAAYVHKLGPVDLLAGFASGYQRRCSTYSVQTGSTYTVTKTDKHYVKTATPVYEQRESCRGFSRGALTPMAGLSIAAPISVLGATPVLFVAPGFGKAASVAHISIQWSIK